MEGRLIGAPMITPELVPLQWSGIKSNPNYGYQNIAPTEQVNDCKLWTAKCRLQTVDCKLPTVDCQLLVHLYALFAISLFHFFVTLFSHKDYEIINIWPDIFFESACFTFETKVSNDWYLVSVASRIII